MFYYYSHLFQLNAGWFYNSSGGPVWVSHHSKQDGSRQIPGPGEETEEEAGEKGPRKTPTVIDQDAFKRAGRVTPPSQQSGGK